MMQYRFLLSPWTVIQGPLRWMLDQACLGEAFLRYDFFEITQDERRRIQHDTPLQTSLKSYARQAPCLPAHPECFAASKMYRRMVA